MTLVEGTAAAVKVEPAAAAAAAAAGNPKRQTTHDDTQALQPPLPYPKLNTVLLSPGISHLYNYLLCANVVICLFVLPTVSLSFRRKTPVECFVVETPGVFCG